MSPKVIKKMLPIVPILLLISLASCSNFKKERAEREIDALAAATITQAEVYRAEKGTYPKSFEELNFKPACQSLLVKFKPDADQFIVSVTNESQNIAVTRDANRNRYLSDKLDGQEGVVQCQKR